MEKKIQVTVMASLEMITHFVSFWCRPCRMCSNSCLREKYLTASAGTVMG